MMARFEYPLLLAIAAALVAAMPCSAFGAGRPGISGPVTAEVIRVVDGDTVEVRAYPWPQQSVDVLVRLRGIDAPEIHGTCLKERQGALRAKAILQTLLDRQPRIFLSDIGGGKYFGRVLANIGLADGRDAASELILEDLVRPYDGGRKPASECLSAASS